MRRPSGLAQVLGKSRGKSLQTPSPDVIWIGRTRV